MRWDFHSISQQESVLVDFHRKSNLPVTEIPNLIRIVYLRIGEKLSTRFSKIGIESMSDNLARASSAREYQIELQQVGINTATSPMQIKVDEPIPDASSRLGIDNGSWSFSSLPL
ncbi:hypothetical protein VNO78_35218 [Psophocarpus tetragonolobus]|uniref:Uncharacterized protein n=1 Tax=Psophocarpus tetragonolobus TaxID=3891 RepID=A0AAN9RR68_PSOTE